MKQAYIVLGAAVAFYTCPSEESFREHISHLWQKQQKKDVPDNALTQTLFKVAGNAARAKHSVSAWEKGRDFSFWIVTRV